MILNRDENSEQALQHVFETNIGLTWSAGYNPFNRRINSMPEEVEKQMLREFASQNFTQKINSK